jgi:hypothetical protein
MVLREWDQNPCLPVPKSLITRVTKEWLSGNYLFYWNLQSGSKQSKVCWIKRPSLKLVRFLINLPRTKLGALIGLITGHVRLNKHLHKMGLLSDPTCAACSIEKESTLHFICMCPTLANLRTQLFGKPILSVSEYEEMSAGFFVQLALYLRLVFNKTSIMGCTLGPISGPRAEVVCNFTH